MHFPGIEATAGRLLVLFLVKANGIVVYCNGDDPGSGGSVNKFVFLEIKSTNSRKNQIGSFYC